MDEQSSEISAYKWKSNNANVLDNAQEKMKKQYQYTKCMPYL